MNKDIEYYLFEDGFVSGERYSEREQFWTNKGLWCSGYTPYIEQVYLKLMLYKEDKDNLEQTINSIEEIIPFLKPQKDGMKHLGIFEHTLSEFGIWSVKFDEEEFQLNLCCYGRESIEKRFDNLRSLVEYVQQHHYYEISKEREY